MKLTLVLALSAFLYLFFTATVFAQDHPKFQTDIKSGPTPWTHTRFLDDDAAFTFAIVADLTGGYREGVFPEAVDKLNRLRPEFVISIGDMIEGYTEDSLQIDRWWEQFNGWVSKLNMPYFYMPGNHDVTNNLLVKKWETLYGKTYYHFVYKGVLFMVLNSEEEGEERISAAQAGYFREVLERYPNVKQTVMLVHSPLWRDDSQRNFQKIEGWFGDRPYTVFAGHTHHYQKAVRNGRNYYVLSTTGGGSNLLGPEFGEFDQIALVHSHDTETAVVNLTLDGVLPDDVVTDRGAVLGSAFSQSSTLSYSPIYRDQRTEFLETTVSLTNYTDQILRLEGRFFYNPTLIPHIHETNQMILPGKTLDIPLKIKATNYSQKEGPLVLNYSLETESKEQPYLHLESQLELYVAETFSVNSYKKGDSQVLSEITVLQPGKLGYYAHTWQGPADCSLTFSVSYDKEHLYLKANVTDQDVIENHFRNYWEKDGMEFLFRFPAEVGDRENSYKNLRIGFSPYSDDQHPPFKSSEPLFAAIPLTSKLEEGGYTTTLMLPIRLLEIFTRQSLKTFFLQVKVYDHDGSEDKYQGTEFSWHAGFPGAGRFETTF